MFLQSDVEKKIKNVLEPLSLFTTYGDDDGNFNGMFLINKIFIFPKMNWDMNMQLVKWSNPLKGLKYLFFHPLLDLKRIICYEHFYPFFCRCWRKTQSRTWKTHYSNKCMPIDHFLSITIPWIVKIKIYKKISLLVFVVQLYT